MRKKRLRLLASLLTGLSTALGGYLLIERGSARPGILMILAGLATTVIMLRKKPNQNEEEER